MPRQLHILLQRFLPRAVPFAAETPPAREVTGQSRTIKGSGAGGVATLSAAGVEVAQSVLTETQSAVLPLVPYLEPVGWVLVALAAAATGPLKGAFLRHGFLL